MERCKFTGPIVSAVAYEIERIARADERGEPEPLRTEGLAHKCAFHRAGSDFLKHHETAAIDAAVMSICAKPAMIGRTSHGLALLEAKRVQA